MPYLPIFITLTIFPLFSGIAHPLRGGYGPPAQSAGDYFADPYFLN